MSALLGCLRVGAGVARARPALAYDAAQMQVNGSQLVGWQNTGVLGSAYDLVPAANAPQYVASGGYQNGAYVTFLGNDFLQTLGSFHQLSPARTLLLRVWLSADAIANGRNLSGYGVTQRHQMSDFLVLNGGLFLHVFDGAFDYLYNQVPAGQWITLAYRVSAPVNGAQPLRLYRDTLNAGSHVAGIEAELPPTPLRFGAGIYEPFNKSSELRLQKAAFYIGDLSDAQFALAYNNF